jgi:hypothetical protein
LDVIVVEVVDDVVDDVEDKVFDVFGDVVFGLVFPLTTFSLYDFLGSGTLCDDTSLDSIEAFSSEFSFVNFSIG